MSVFLQIFQFVLAIVPTLLLCWYIYHLDKYEKEDFVVLAVHFVLGVLVAIPVYYLERYAALSGLENPGNFWATVVFAFLVVAFVEEVAKFLPLGGWTYRAVFFNEPIDGIVYAVFVAMGFAAFENGVYAWKHDMGTTVVRAFTAVPAHAAFGVIQGYYAGLARFDGRKRPVLVLLKGLLVSVLVHGLYDFFLEYELYDWLVLLALAVLGLSVYYARRLVGLQQERSPFK